MHAPPAPSPDFAAELLRGHLANDEQGLVQIETAADRVLAETGLRFESDPETLDLWRENGATIRDERVTLDGAWLRQVIRATAPRRITLRGRNPARDTILGDGHAPVFTPIYGAPNVLDHAGRRSLGSRAHYRRAMEIAHASSAISNTGQMICVMDDVPEARRPLEIALMHLSLSDKPFMGSIASPGDVEAVIDAAVAAIGRPPRPGEAELLHLVNATPPLVYKENPLKCLRTIARRAQASLVTSYMMMGATSPVTIAGSLIQGYAEVLAGMALAQLWRPGAPVVMGLYAIPFGMRSMVPCYGDPASHLLQHYATQLARRLGVPVRGEGGVTSSKLDDGQAGLESALTLSASISSGADFILHGAGWLEQGRCLSLGKLRREAARIAETCGFDMQDCSPPPPLDPAFEQDLRARIAAI